MNGRECRIGNILNCPQGCKEGFTVPAKDPVFLSGGKRASKETPAYVPGKLLELETIQPPLHKLPLGNHYLQEPFLLAESELLVFCFHFHVRTHGKDSNLSIYRGGKLSPIVELLATWSTIIVSLVVSQQKCIC